MVNTEVKKVNKEFKLLVLVVVRKSSIVKLEKVLGGGVLGYSNWESVIFIKWGVIRMRYY